MGNKSGVLAFDVSCACLCQLSAGSIALRLHSVCVSTSITALLACVVSASLLASLLACLPTHVCLLAPSVSLLLTNRFSHSPHPLFQILSSRPISISLLSHGSFPISRAPLRPPPHLNTHTQPHTTSPPRTLSPATALSPSPARSCLSLWTCSWPPAAWPLPAFDRCTRLATPLHAIHLSHNASPSA